MAIKNYTKHVAKKGLTAQTEPIPDSNQEKNNAGGFAWKTDPWNQLQRFLVIGSEGGTYYVKEPKLTTDNTKTIQSLIKQDGCRVVKEIVEISDSGRAAKNDPAIFALALCLTYGDNKTKNAAKDAVPQVCRIGTHIFALAEAINSMRGWGRGIRKAFANWYENKDASDLSYQMIKYQNRNNWSHKDLLRLCHPTGKTVEHRALYQYATGKSNPDSDTNVKLFKGKENNECAKINWLKNLPLVVAAEKAKTASSKELIKLISDNNLPRECLPTESLNDVKVWEALLNSKMPMTAMIRNLATMTRVGLLDSGSDATKLVVKTLLNQEILKKARIHPISVLVALKTYQAGRGMRGSNTWSPVTKIVDALDECFYLSFGNVEPTNKRIMLALDVSGSMSGGSCSGCEFLTPREGSVAMALVTARVEKDYEIMAFSDKLVPITISPKQRLDDVIRMTERIPFGGTDCSLPMKMAYDKNGKYDSFITYTDSETYAGKGHPSEWLKKYRDKSGINAKSVVVGMCGNNFTIADPQDDGSLDVVGFDTNTPNVLSWFISKPTSTGKASTKE